MLHVEQAPASGYWRGVQQQVDQFFQRPGARVAEGDMTPVGASHDVYAVPVPLSKPGQDVGGLGIPLAGSMSRTSRSTLGLRCLVIPYPPLGLAHRKVATEHYLQPLFLSLGRGQADQGPRVSGCDRTCRGG